VMTWKCQMRKLWYTKLINLASFNS
jgi:hypothetical protein